MTGKEIVNLIRQLRLNGMSDSKILDLIEYIETHDPQEKSEDEQPPAVPHRIRHIPTKEPPDMHTVYREVFSLPFLQLDIQPPIRPSRNPRLRNDLLIAVDTQK